MATTPLEQNENITTIEVSDSGVIMAQTTSEINQQIKTAHEWVRSIEKFRQDAAALITQDLEAAAACFYALPRGKEKNPDTGQWERKIIKGPTTRFAELIAFAWGNCRYGARIVSESPTHVTAQGMFHDLERNMAISCEIQRPIVNKDGVRYSADLIGVTGNAACSIARRNSVLYAIPQAVWKGLYAAAERTIMGDIKTLVDRRKAMFDLFKPYGLTIPMLCELVGVAGQSEVTGEQLVTLQGMLTALRDGDTTVESLLADSQDRAVASKGQQTLEAIKAQYRKPEVVAPAAAREDVKEVARQAQEKLDTKRKQSKEKDMASISEIELSRGAIDNKEPF